MKRMIFHYPNPFDFNASSASKIRPIQMMQAFKNIGYEVEVISGYAKERKEKIKKLKEQIKKGKKFDFLYSESLTMPTLLSQKNHLPTLDFKDFEFFKFCKQNNIKIGLFYRDIYWAFSDYGKDISFFKREFARFFYYYDLFKYKNLVDILYLPSQEMAKYIPIINPLKTKALPPGHNIYKEQEVVHNKTTLLYIGGLGEHYKMHKLFEAVSSLKDINLIVCTREKEWQKVKDSYIVAPNINVVHKSGKELEELYKASTIATLFVKPKEYREFAMPVKLFEYIGYEKPIIATKNTLAGKFIQKNNIGWSIEYDTKKLINLLQNLKDMEQKRQNIKKIKPLHTWEARALKVAKELSGENFNLS